MPTSFNISDPAAVNSVLLLASVFSFGIQQGMQLIVDPFLEASKERWLKHWPFRLYSPEYAKRLLLGWLVLLIGMLASSATGFNVPYYLGLTNASLHSVGSLFISGLILSNAVEVSNSLVKWFAYAKEVKKIEARSSEVRPSSQV